MNKNPGIIIGITVIVLIVGGIYVSNNKKHVMSDEEKDKAMIGSKDQKAIDEDMIKDQTMAKEVTKNIESQETNKTDEMITAGIYEAYTPEKISNASDDKQVILFFRASWCPSCQSLDKDIRANLSKIPSNLTILDVDYDKYKDLKKKYLVTYQHTFVQVDRNGNMIKKWSGSPTLSDLVRELK